MRRTAIILSLCVAIDLVPAVLLSVEPPRPACGAVALMMKLDRYLAAGDYRRALELAQREVDETSFGGQLYPSDLRVSRDRRVSGVPFARRELDRR